ncbi:hypothetical protein [Mycolicibacterium brumae]|uniref:hypothetical protein n=1 Tax=Mycolicibacterium brumae TaxID=85968 RepID=UPI000AF8E538|nr:hypothetical protein [Mycolicibacterium brumae]MCV7192796.1 hypothetical protein [Mycolicibacterium brumae]RWA23385.1 hypothetical protein MBRU_00775 [Mycolicibacterium brumae DSM 44177]UWW08684.1 hypothetical protein L2Z93_001747 [Mycolicibacterium brumae]
MGFWRWGRTRADGDHAVVGVVAPAESLSPPEFAVVAYLFAAPGHIGSAQCARALGRDVTDLLTTFADLAERELIETRHDNAGDIDYVAVTDAGRRAFIRAQSPCCARF